MAVRWNEKKVDAVIKKMQENPEGFTKAELERLFGLNKIWGVHSIISYIRVKKGIPFTLHPKSRKYYLTNKEPGKKPLVPVLSGDKQKIDGIKLKPEMIEKLRKLDPEDAKNVIDFMKRSDFYRRSAKALIEASENSDILYSFITNKQP